MRLRFWNHHATQSPGPIGLDLGTRCIRMVQTAPAGEGLAVVACAKQMVPVDMTTWAQYEQFAIEAVRAMRTRAPFRGRDTVTHVRWGGALNDAFGSGLQIRHLRVPLMPRDQIAGCVRREAAERFNIDPAHTQLRFLLAGDVPHGGQIRSELIVLGISASAVQAHAALVRRAGLAPVAIDAGPCAVFRGFARRLRRHTDRNAGHAILDLGYSATRLIVGRGGDIVFLKSFPIGWQLRGQPSFPPSSSLDIPAGAESEKVSDPQVEQLAREIGLALRYCAGTFRGPQIEQVLAVGGGAHNTSLLAALSDRLDVPVCPAAPQPAVEPEFACALGLALKRPASSEACVA
jgi:Tfp pilus assembly PilM family ATPase